MSSKYQINKNDFQLWIEATSIKYPPEDTMVTFWTKWNGAKQPDEMHRQYEQVFTVKDLDRLIDVFISIRDAAVARSPEHQAIE